MYTQTLLNAVSAAGAGAAVEPDNKRGRSPESSVNTSKRTFQISGTFVGTVKVQVSNDNTNWEDLITSTTTGGWESNAAWQYVRGNVTAYTSGSITLVMAVQ